MAKRKISRSSLRWGVAGRLFGGDINRLKCTDADLFHRPDHVKLQYATYVTEFEPGKSKADRFESNAKIGPLHEVEDIDHWAIEEYFWHGVPGDRWHPLEAYLDLVGDHLSDAGKAQLRQWKEARFGVYRIGPVKGETVTLEEWDIGRRAVIGESFRAISLGIGGASVFRDLRNHVMFGYVSPWRPAENLYCSMGYSTMPKAEEAEALAPLLGFYTPKLVGTPLPWKVSPATQRRYLREWRERDWITWLDERLKFPFRALLLTPIKGKLRIVTATQLIGSSREVAEQWGIYVRTGGVGEVTGAGLSSMMVFELDSPNYGPATEYREYRHLVGPPPEARGRPFIQVGRKL